MSVQNIGLKRPILNARVNFPITLAPMVGLSHVAFRRLLRGYLPSGACTIWPTEMLNSRRIPGENLARTPETMRAPNESELVPQILGNEERPIALSVRRLEHEWGAAGVDINMGCPVKKALSHNYGVALMGDASYAAEVVRMTVASTTLPVSVKLRALAAPAGEPGSITDLGYLLKFVEGLQEAGAAWITLHPRTAEQKRRGAADWRQIRELRTAVKIPVIGNGDIQTDEDALAMLESTGCDMAMVGRALTARPWLLWQLGEKLGFAAPPGREGERAPRTPLEEGREYGRALNTCLIYMREHFSDDLVLRKFRFLVRTGAPWLHFGQDLYARSNKAKTTDELALALELFFSSEQAMVGRTELRQ
jgi:tRNA-dihydrouridine synthase